MQSIDRLIPIRAAFALIGVRPTKGYDLVTKRQLAAVRVGARTFVRQSELERFLEEVPRPVRPASAARRSAEERLLSPYACLGCPGSRRGD